MTKNYFAIFGFEPHFNLDLNALEAKYFALQQQFHPDKASIKEIENSILVNEGYKILQNNLLRAAHILQLNGIDVEQDGGAIKPDISTLEEVLEIQEKIPSLSLEEKMALKKSLNLKIKLLLENFAKELENKSFEAAAQILIKAKYFDKTIKII